MSNLSFNIDLSQVVKEFSIGSSDIRDLGKVILDEVSKKVLINWQNAAKKELHATRSNYIKGIVLIKEGEFRNAIVLKGPFNNMIENGISSFDMKAGFSKSGKIKISKDGKWYLRIPFRFASSNSLGENSAFSGILPKGIEKLLKSKEANKTQLGGKVSSGKGIKADEIPKNLLTIGKNKTSGYVHKSSIFEGIQKSEKFYEEKNQGQYFSIRTASAKSNPNSWIHSGIKAHNFAEKALRNSNLQTIVDNEIDKYIAGLK